MKQETVKLRIALGVAAVAVGIAFLLVVNTGHVLNGDYALYVCQARKLLSGEQWQAYQDMGRMLQLSTDSHYSPILYPWGVPLLLAMPCRVFGINYWVFKLMIAGCLLATLFILYKDAVRSKEWRSGMWTLLFVGMNATIALSIHRVLSTLPYMLFLHLALLMANRWLPAGILRGKAQWASATAVGVALFMAVQMRTEGVLLFPALLLHQLANMKYAAGIPRKERWAETLLPYGVFLVLFLGTLPYLPVGYMVHAGHPQDVEVSAWGNWAFYLTAAPQCCLPFLPSGNVWVAVIFWGMAGAGMYTDLHRRSVAAPAYLLLNIMLLGIWPYKTERYLMPLVPLCIYFAAQGTGLIFRFLRSRQAWVTDGVLLFGLTCQLANWGMRMHSLKDEYDEIRMDVTGKNAQEAFAFLREHAQPEDIVACGESRTVYLYTGLLSCNLSLSVADTAEKASWYLVFKNRGDYLQHTPKELEDHPELFRRVYANDDLILYKILRP